VYAVNGVRSMRFCEALGGLLHFGYRIGIEQLAEIGLAEEFAQLILIDGERLSAALGEWRVAVVNEVGHIAEE
jgi:hypothetical protein